MVRWLPTAFTKKLIALSRGIRIPPSQIRGRNHTLQFIQRGDDSRQQT